MTEARLDRIQEVLSNRQSGLGVLLENVFDPHNIAAVMRSCDAVGIQDIFILHTNLSRQKPMHNYDYRSSRSSNKWLTIHQYTDMDTCVAAIRARYARLYTTHLSEDAMDLFQIDFAAESVCLAFGNEQLGLTSELLEQSDGNFVIPQVGMIKSLNISVACAISIYEAYRQKKIAGHYEQATLDASYMAELEERWIAPKAKKTI